MWPLLSLLLAGQAALPVPIVTPVERPLYLDGPRGRHLLEEGWTGRSDPRDIGMRQGWFRVGTTAGFVPTTVPDSFNRYTLTRSGFRSWVHWYRIRFRRPDVGAAGWAVRFESVNRRAHVFVNGRFVGSGGGQGLPFEVPARAVRRGENELVVRVDGRRRRNELPPAGRPQGWWNYTGILGEVYLRRLAPLDMGDVQVRTRGRDPARVFVSAYVRNHSNREWQARIGRVSLTEPSTAAAHVPAALTRSAPVAVGPGRLVRVSAAFSVPAARLWSPRAPHLYALELGLPGGHRTRLHFGVRTWGRDRAGRLLLNGRPLALRGASFHEQVPGRGAALTPADRADLVTDLVALGANATRQHYPPHPALLEAFDRLGIVFWEQIPVWRLRGRQLADPAITRAALSQLRRAVLRDRNHASVLAWSVANETLRGGRAESLYLRAARRVLRRLDPSRPMAVDVSLRPTDDLSRAYRRVDAIGLNEYVGWYAGSISQLRPDLARVRAAFPEQALVVTELGAESNRAGAASAKGTYDFQRQFVTRHLAELDRVPYLSGALVWLLRDFVMRPGWSGGNPRPAPPFNQKGLMRRDRAPKPAFAAVREAFRRVTRYPP